GMRVHETSAKCRDEYSRADSSASLRVTSAPLDPRIAVLKRKSIEPPHAIDRMRGRRRDLQHVSITMRDCQVTLLRCCCAGALFSADLSIAWPNVPGIASFRAKYSCSMVS